MFELLATLGIMIVCAIAMLGVPTERKARKGYVKSKQANGYPKYTKINHYK